MTAHKLLGFSDIALVRDLHLQFAATEAEIEDLLDIGRLAIRKIRVVFGDLVTASDTKVNSALADESRDVGGREKDQRDWEVFDQGDVEAIFATELDVTAGEEVESSLLQAALCRERGVSSGPSFYGCDCESWCRLLTLGYREKEPSFQAEEN